MSKAYPWVERPWPEKELPKDELLERIEQLLGLKNVCVLATVDKDGSPIASPIEYHADGLNLYMLPDPGTPKLNAMKRDPRVAGRRSRIPRMAERSKRPVFRACRNPGPEHA